MAEHPLKVFEKADPELFKRVTETSTFAFADGALPRKYKLLIAMVLDAADGHVDGVKSLTQRALEAGATKDEVMDTLRVGHYICGAGCVYTAAAALKEIF
jgi:alkylhydroperoxidase/carboxymuconolactone decarboxylase family protein YurZ